MLGDGVGGHLLVQPGSHPGHGGGVDDLAGLPGLPHPLHGQLRTEHHGDDVDLHALPPAKVGVDPGIVCQDVDTRHLEELLGPVKQGSELLLLTPDWFTRGLRSRPYLRHEDTVKHLTL